MLISGFCFLKPLIYFHDCSAVCNCLQSTPFTKNINHTCTSESVSGIIFSFSIFNSVSSLITVTWNSWSNHCYFLSNWEAFKALAFISHNCPVAEAENMILIWKEFQVLHFLANPGAKQGSKHSVDGCEWNGWQTLPMLSSLGPQVTAKSVGN